MPPAEVPLKEKADGETLINEQVMAAGYRRQSRLSIERYAFHRRINHEKSQ